MMISAIRKRGIGHAEERNEAEQRIDPAVLAGGRDDAEGDADDRREDMAGQRQQDGARQALGDDIADRAVVVERLAEIEAGQDAPDPVEILQRQRQVEAVGDAIGLRPAARPFPRVAPPWLISIDLR